MSDKRITKCQIIGCRSSSRNAQVFTVGQQLVCIHHFEARFLKRSNDATTFLLEDEAVPTLLLDDDTSFLETKPKRKRGSSGLANLQKARLRKKDRKERLKNQLLMRNLMKNQNGNRTLSDKTTNSHKIPIISEVLENNVAKDYFLGNREPTVAEQFIIPLRMTTFIDRLRDGSNLCKLPPESINDATIFPILNMIRNIDGLSDTNPIEWTPQQTFMFIKHVSPVRGIAKILRSEEVDGEALLNLKRSDLTGHFFFDNKSSERLISVFAQLRLELIKRYINI